MIVESSILLRPSKTRLDVSEKCLEAEVMTYAKHYNDTFRSTFPHPISKISADTVDNRFLYSNRGFTSLDDFMLSDGVIPYLACCCYALKFKRKNPL